MKIIESNKKLSLNLALIIVLIGVFLVSGQQGCPAPQTGPGGPTGQAPVQTSASNLGFDFAFADEGIGYLTNGKSIRLGELFQIKLKLENAGKNQKSGRVCMKDDFDDSYGGLREECQNFFVREATYSGEKILQTASADLIFGRFSYKEFPKSRDGKIFVTVSYPEQSLVEGDIVVPGTQSGKVQTAQQPIPLDVVIDKRVSLRENGYEVELSMSLSKKSKDLKIKAPDSGKEGLIIDARLGRAAMSCDYTDSSEKYLKFADAASTSLINCKAVVPSEEQVSHPLLVTLVYEAEVSREVAFKLEVTDQKTA